MTKNPFIIGQGFEQPTNPYEEAIKNKEENKDTSHIAEASLDDFSFFSTTSGSTTAEESKAEVLEFDLGMEVNPASSRITLPDKMSNPIIERFKPQLMIRLKEKYAMLDEFQSDILGKDFTKPVRVMASAGSGKSTTLIYSCLKLILEEGVTPSKVVLFTFTNKAAGELKEKYLDFFKGILPEELIEKIPLPAVSTLHSFCYNVHNRVLALSHKSIMSEYQSSRMIRECMQTVIGDEEKITIAQSIFFADALHKMIAEAHLHFAVLPILDVSGKLVQLLEYPEYTFAEDEVIATLDKLSSHYLSEKIECEGEEPSVTEEDKTGYISYYANEAKVGVVNFVRITKMYFERKLMTNVMDFSDMMQNLIFYLVQHPEARKMVHKRYNYFFLDEAQDTDFNQYAAIFLCDEDSHNTLLGELE